MAIRKGCQLLKSEGYVHTDCRSGTIIATKNRTNRPMEEVHSRLQLVLAKLRLQGLGDDEILDVCRICLKEER